LADNGKERDAKNSLRYVVRAPNLGLQRHLGDCANANKVCEAKICQLDADRHFLCFTENVFELEVSVDNGLFVEVGDAGENVMEDWARLCFCETTEFFENLETRSVKEYATHECG
jgi:hypothetical protein